MVRESAGRWRGGLNEDISGAVGRAGDEKRDLAIASKAGCAKSLAGEQVSDDIVAVHGTVSMLAVRSVIAACVHVALTVGAL